MIDVFSPRGPKWQIPSVNIAAQSLDYQPVSKVITNEGISEITLHVLY